MSQLHTIDDICAILSRQRFTLEDEKNLQRQIDSALNLHQVEADREVHLDRNNIIDFKIGGIGIEVKIKGSKKNIFRQLVRYAEFEDITSLILLTNKSMRLMPLLNNKPVRVINLGTAWL